MNNQYNINDWARDQRNARDAENIARLATQLRLKFPRTNLVLTVLVTVISFVFGIRAGIDAHRKPLGVVLYGVISSLIGGTLAYAFSILILAIIIVIIVVKLIQPYL